MSPPRQLQQHKLYAWNDLGQAEKRQIVRGHLRDHPHSSKLRFFVHRGVLFDTTHFTTMAENGWHSDGGPVHIRMNEQELEVGIRLSGRVVQVRPFAGVERPLPVAVELPDPVLVVAGHADAP